MPPGKEQVDALLRDESPVSEKGEELVSEAELGAVLIDIRKRFSSAS